MDRWLVTQGDHQFAVEGMPALLDLAQAGKLRGGDLVQPPGASDWVYALEVPALKNSFDDTVSDEFDDDLYVPRRGLGPIVPAVIGSVLALLLVTGIGAAAMLATQLPTGNEAIVGVGGDLSYSEMLVTEANAPLLADASPQAKQQATLAKDEVVELLAKRGGFYRARTRSGAEGWVAASHVVPMYQFGDAAVQSRFDPLYNPDRYVEVSNASWMQLPGQPQNRMTVFNLELRNMSDYPMTDVVLLATIKDARGQKLETIEIPVEGIVPAQSRTLIGTLAPDRRDRDGVKRVMTQSTFDELAAEDQELQLRFSAGAQVQMTAADFDAAQIDFLELRAIPNEVASNNR